MAKGLFCFLWTCGLRKGFDSPLWLTRSVAFTAISEDTLFDFSDILFMHAFKLTHKKRTVCHAACSPDEDTEGSDFESSDAEEAEEEGEEEAEEETEGEEEEKEEDCWRPHGACIAVRTVDPP